MKIIDETKVQKTTKEKQKKTERSKGNRSYSETLEAITEEAIIEFYNNAVKEIISDTSNFEKLNEDPTLKREASLQRFLCKFKQKNCFNEIEYDTLYPSGSAPARIYGTLKIHKFSFSGLFPNFRPIVSSIGAFNYNLARLLCDILSPLVPNDYPCKDFFSFVS